MRDETKKNLNVAVNNLKNDGYAVIMICINQKKALDPSAQSLEVLCSETNDPRILRAMLMNTLQILSHPEEEGRLN